MNILTGCTSLLNLWYLSDNQSKMAPVVPFLIDWVEFRQEYLPVTSADPLLIFPTIAYSITIPELLRGLSL